LEICLSDCSKLTLTAKKSFICFWN